MPTGSFFHRSTPVLSALACVASIVCSGCVWAQDLSSELAAVLGRARLGNAGVGVSIVDVQSGRELASHRGDERLIPASNLKLLTSGAAVAVLGPNYEFRTEVIRHGDRIIIKGAGDPAFADPLLLEQMRVSLDTFMSRIVDSITKVGMTRCDEIVVDDRIFDREYVHPEWPRDQLDKGYCAEVSGLNFHANVLRIFASPASRDQDPAHITTEPAGAGIEIKRRARTVRGSNRSTAIGAIRDGTTNTFTVAGTVNAPLEVPAETTLHEPSLVFARLLAEKLASAGVKPGDTSAPAALCRLVAADEDFGRQDAVLAVIRTPLSLVLERCNRDSENMYAESLLKLLGHSATRQPGTWANGTSVVRLQVRDRVGPDAAATLILSDGSGMSRVNKISARVMSRWLVSLAQDRVAGPAFIESIPRARAEGTMRRRFTDKSLANEVRGKSGLLNGVRTLSGYVSDVESGRRVAYSVLVNNIPPDVTAARVKSFHEEVVMIADKWLARQSDTGVQERLGGGESRRK